jgi:hypothetical protein
MEPTKARITPRDFFLWAGAMIALYWSAVSFIFLLFNYINVALPNPLLPAPDPYQGGMPYEMASLIVLVPLYVVLTHYIRRSIAIDPSRKDVWVRRWAIILTLFVAVATVAGDVITLLTTFFRGEELTTAFVLKVVIVLAVAGVGFLYFLKDLKGYWDDHRAGERTAAMSLGAVAVIAIIAGFFIVGTPYQARLMRFDNERVSDLQNIQYQVVSYWQRKQALPASLDALQDPISGYLAPVDPETGAPYEYAAAKGQSFELCATFDRADQNPSSAYMGYPTAPGGMSADSWAHPAGRHCFERTIDPALYPPYPKTAQ